MLRASFCSVMCQEHACTISVDGHNTDVAYYMLDIHDVTQKVEEYQLATYDHERCCGCHRDLREFEHQTGKTSVTCLSEGCPCQLCYDCADFKGRSRDRKVYLPPLGNMNRSHWQIGSCGSTCANHRLMCHVCGILGPSVNARGITSVTHICCTPSCGRHLCVRCGRNAQCPEEIHERKPRCFAYMYGLCTHRLQKCGVLNCEHWSCPVHRTMMQ